jgi:aspartyl protease family protein
MGRIYLFVVAALGLFGWLASQLPPPSAPEIAAIPVVADAVQPQPAETAVNHLDGSLTLERSGNGHFYADVAINGTPVHMLVDTGASGIALSRDDARSAGVATSIGMNDVVGQGADGAVRGEWIQLDRVELGPVSATGLPAIVLNSGEQSLLGQAFLGKFAAVEIHGDTMVLR